jgi:hypothetical protein
MFKTTSGSSPRIDLSNNITYSRSQSHATVPLSCKHRSTGIIRGRQGLGSKQRAKGT